MKPARRAEAKERPSTTAFCRLNRNWAAKPPTQKQKCSNKKLSAPSRSPLAEARFDNQPLWQNRQRGFYRQN